MQVQEWMPPPMELAQMRFPCEVSALALRHAADACAGHTHVQTRTSTRAQVPVPYKSRYKRLTVKGVGLQRSNTFFSFGNTIHAR